MANEIKWSKLLCNLIYYIVTCRWIGVHWRSCAACCVWSGSKQWVSQVLDKQAFETFVFPCCCLRAGLMMLGYSQVSQCLAWYGVWMPHRGNTMKTCSCGQALWVTNCGTFLRPESSIQTGPIVWAVRSAARAHIWQKLHLSVWPSVHLSGCLSVWDCRWPAVVNHG